MSNASHKLRVPYLLNNEPSGGSSDKPFRCDLCPHAFRVKGDLAKHKRNVHLGQRKHQCPYCTDKFAEKGNLNKHITRKHTKTKEYKCPVAGCNKAFPTSDGLLRHKRQVHSSSR